MPTLIARRASGTTVVITSNTAGGLQKRAGLEPLAGAR